MKRNNYLWLCALLLCASWMRVPDRNLTGTYAGGFGGEIMLRSDSTFFYQWRFDLLYSWNRGTWTSNKDTIWLEIIPVYDTLNLNWRTGGPKRDSLLLSRDTVPQRLDDFIVNLAYTGGQSSHTLPLKLIYLNNRLYPPDAKGRPGKKSHYKFGNRKYPACYQRVDPGAEKP